jgi:hypothetical protein
MFRRGDRRDKAEAPDDVRAAEDDELLDDDELAEGEEEGELEDQPEDMTADLESQAADYLADNDVWMYGPNAVAVLDILDRLEELVPAEARPLAEAWLAIPKSDRDQARKAAKACRGGPRTRPPPATRPRGRRDVDGRDRPLSRVRQRRSRVGPPL